MREAKDVGIVNSTYKKLCLTRLAQSRKDFALSHLIFPLARDDRQSQRGDLIDCLAFILSLNSIYEYDFNDVQTMCMARKKFIQSRSEQANK